MKFVVKILFIITSLVLIVYILLPNPDFPSFLPGSLQSVEPADVETTLRRAYYTDLTRQEVMNHYTEQFNKSSVLNLPLPTYRLNYPPEDSQSLIRDQTKSTFLEEIVHPFRESLYINGFEPTQANQVIIVDGKQWRQKVIVRYVSSNPAVRVVVFLVTIVLIAVLVNKWGSEAKTIRKHK